MAPRASTMTLKASGLEPAISSPLVSSSGPKGIGSVWASGISSVPSPRGSCRSGRSGTSRERQPLGELGPEPIQVDQHPGAGLVHRGRAVLDGFSVPDDSLRRHSVQTAPLRALSQRLTPLRIVPSCKVTMTRHTQTQAMAVEAAHMSANNTVITSANTLAVFLDHPVVSEFTLAVVVDVVTAHGRCRRLDHSARLVIVRRGRMQNNPLDDSHLQPHCVG